MTLSSVYGTIIFVAKLLKFGQFGGCGEAVNTADCGSVISWVRSPPVTPQFLSCCLSLGRRQVGKARDFDSRMRWFESSRPSQNDSLAQLVEHLTFNQGVPGSSPGWITNFFADVAELADALDLGSSGKPCRFNSCHPHQI